MLILHIAVLRYIKIPNLWDTKLGCLLVFLLLKMDFQIKKSIFNLLMLGFIVLGGCTKAEDPLVCTTNATLLIGDGTNHCASATIEKNDVDNSGNTVLLRVYLDYTIYGNQTIQLQPSTVLEEGKTLILSDRYQEIAIFSTNFQRVISGKASIQKLDKDAKLISFYYEMAAIELNGSNFELSGTLTDLPLK